MGKPPNRFDQAITEYYEDRVKYRIKQPLNNGITKTAIYKDGIFVRWDIKENGTNENIVINCPYIPLKMIYTPTELFKQEYPELFDTPNYLKITKDIVCG